MFPQSRVFGNFGGEVLKPSVQVTTIQSYAKTFVLTANIRKNFRRSEWVKPNFPKRKNLNNKPAIRGASFTPEK
jgi:hypothetical protein